MSTRRPAKSVLSTAAISLPRPSVSGGKPLERCLQERRSCRSFGDASLSVEHASQLLWAAQGVTGLGGLRTAPSAGAVYPLRTYLIALRVERLPSGAYLYGPDEHSLTLWKAGDLRPELLGAACNQDEADTAALGILLTARYSRSKREFGEKGVALALIEAGHAAQNILLQATSLSLGSIGFGKLDESEMRRVLELPDTEHPVYLLLAGPREATVDPASQQHS